MGVTHCTPLVWGAGALTSSSGRFSCARRCLFFRVVEPGVGYGTLVVPLIVAGAGIGMIFATTASAATSAVPADDTGVAAGTNTALRELGGVFGVAILAAVFAQHGGYASPESFIDGFKPALWVAAAVPLIGVMAAALTPGRRPAGTERRTGQGI